MAISMNENKNRRKKKISERTSTPAVWLDSSPKGGIENQIQADAPHSLISAREFEN
jgi:hypothetical protein